PAMRTTALCLIALTLAFAPAPFPRAKKKTTEDDLARLQGTWERVTLNGQAEPQLTVATIRGDRMQYPSAEDAWILKLDVTRRPKHVDFVHVQEKMHFRGVYKLEGDTFTYSLSEGAEQHRPTDFDTKRPGAWVGVYKRKKW